MLLGKPFVPVTNPQTSDTLGLPSSSSSTQSHPLSPCSLSPANTTITEFTKATGSTHLQFTSTKHSRRSDTDSEKISSSPHANEDHENNATNMDTNLSNHLLFSEGSNTIQIDSNRHTDANPSVQPTPVVTPLQYPVCPSDHQPTSDSNSNDNPDSLLAPKSRPGMIRFYSTPTLPYLSPTRQQFRLPNAAPRFIKETLNASLQIDETRNTKTINQYLIQKEAGRGSFGTVWLVVDTTTNEQYAMKEYSKATLRRHKQSEQLRERRTARRKGPAAPRSKLALAEPDDTSNPMNLIRREIAIMKKLDHPNIVTLVEVLDDPHGDSLYMILEWCCKGAIMSTEDEDTEELESAVRPRYSPEQCRLYFRDLILGIEYLHSQGVIHMDIKADNLLLDEDDVMKIADFGVSELLDSNNDTITKNAGSPAYMAPELAALSSHAGLKEHATHKGINVYSLSGKSTDIWSMGVTLYLLVFGHLPFRSDNMVDLFDKIVNEDVELPDDVDPNLRDLFNKILAKLPQNRITMDELREHPWVTHDNEDMLLSKEENTATNITPVTEEDLYNAIESVQGLLEPTQAIAKLRRLHGWRGYANGNTRSSSLSPSVYPTEPEGRSPSPIGETVSLYKLTRALEEVVKKSGVSPNTRSVHGSTSSVDSSGAPPSLVADINNLHGSGNIIVQSPSSGSNTYSEIASTTKLPLPPSSMSLSTVSSNPKLFDVAFQEPFSAIPPLEGYTAEVPQQTSLTPTLALLGHDSMAPVRSRSLDPDIRL